MGYLNDEEEISLYFAAIDGGMHRLTRTLICRRSRSQSQVL